MELNIYHLYPEHLNLYGDLGNVNCLKRRCEERGIEVNVINFTDDEKPDLNDGDIFFIGGGSDRAQQLVYKDFLQYKDVLKELIEEGRAVLAVCGGYSYWEPASSTSRATIFLGFPFLIMKASIQGIRESLETSSSRQH